MNEQLPEAGWYDNPEGDGERYWDGEQWTDQFRQTQGEAKPSLTDRVKGMAQKGVDRVQQAREEAEAERERQQALVETGVAPPNGEWYRTEVNKGSINMRAWQSNLNRARNQGYRLAHVITQDGNTVQVFEWVGAPGGQGA